MTRLAIVLLCFGLFTTMAAVYPIKVNGRYFVDQNNTPFLLIGDAPHSLVVNPNVGSPDASTYLINRGTNGFNTLWIELLCDSYTAGYATEGSANYGKDASNNNPFTNTLSGGYYNLTTPNPAYWAHVDWIVATAATNGLQCMFTPLDQGGWSTTSLANGSNNCFQYGQYLGNRYANSNNIVWNLGNDFQLWGTATNDSVILAIAAGIKNKDTNHLLTVQLNYYVSQSYYDPAWRTLISMNGVYSYYPTYAETLSAYNTNSMPVLFLEGHYESEAAGGPVSESGTPNVLRRQFYWSMLSGAAGHMYGHHESWSFESVWTDATYGNSPGAIHLNYGKSMLSPRVWYGLVPDQNHSYIIAGYGTYTSSGTVSASDYAVAARTADGSLGIAYTPVAHTLTVTMTNFVSYVTNRWFDPSAGTFTAISGSPFANTVTTNLTTPGNNSAGEGDWVLLSESGSPNTPAATYTKTYAGGTRGGGTE